MITVKLSSSEWGAGVVAELAEYLKTKHPDLKGFTRVNLYRMKKFFETYPGDEISSPVVKQLSWTHNLIIMSQSKLPEERDFYLNLAHRENWSKRELEHQIKSARFEREMTSSLKSSPVVKQIHPEAHKLFRDSYMVDFLDLADNHSENDLHLGLLRHLQKFLTELGRDFCFMGSEHVIQVGNRDFALDLLFFHRDLNCLVAIELKVGRFEPEF